MGVQPERMDRSANPCADFYRFACGGWLDRTTVATDGRVGWSHDRLVAHNELLLKGIADDALHRASNDPGLLRLGAFLASCMDETTIEATGMAPFRQLLGIISSIKDARTLAAALGALHAVDVHPLFRIYHWQWKRQPDLVATLDDADIGLSSWAEYSVTTGDSRNRYRGAIDATMRAMGLDASAASRAADDVLRLETKIATLVKTPVERRDPVGMFNRVTRPELETIAPHFPWGAYFEALGFPTMSALSVFSKPYFSGIDKLVVDVPPTAWRSYLTWGLLTSFSTALPKRIREAMGETADPDRETTCRAGARWKLPREVDRLYAARAFSERDRAAVESLSRSLREALGGHFATLRWMDAETAALARQKLERMVFLFGFPPAWEAPDFPVVATEYGANELRAAASRVRSTLGTIGRPVRRDAWTLAVTYDDASYVYPLNLVKVPAGAMQPPVFDASQPLVAQYARAGVLIAHELAHGFDDQGARNDAEGFERAWWTPGTRGAFEAKKECLRQRLDGYETAAGRVNGALTLSEAMADVGGATIALRAFRATNGDHGLADGFDDDQQFFLSYAQNKCAKLGPEAMKQHLSGSPHPPPEARVNVTLAEMADFSRAFQCEAGGAMNPVERCSLW